MPLWLPEVAELVPRRLLMPGAAVYVPRGNQLVDVGSMLGPRLTVSGSASHVTHRGVPAVAALSSYSASGTLQGPSYGWPYTLFCVGYQSGSTANQGSILDLAENATGYRIAFWHSTDGAGAPGGYAYFNAMFEQAANWSDGHGVLALGDVIAMSITMVKPNVLDVYGSTSRLRPGNLFSYYHGACTAFYPDRVKVGDYPAQGIVLAGFTPRRAWSVDEHLWFVNTIRDRLLRAHLAIGMPAMELSA
jgi:hypothetical protein